MLALVRLNNSFNSRESDVSVSPQEVDRFNFDGDFWREVVVIVKWRCALHMSYACAQNVDRMILSTKKRYRTV